MNVPLGQEPVSRQVVGSADGGITSPATSLNWWSLLSKAVLGVNGIATAAVTLYYLSPSAFNQAWLGALYGYAFISSLVISVAGGLALTIRKSNPWWLLTLPWAVVLLLVLVILSRAMGLAAMH